MNDCCIVFFSYILGFLRFFPIFFPSKRYFYTLKELKGKPTSVRQTNLFVISSDFERVNTLNHCMTAQQNEWKSFLMKIIFSLFLHEMVYSARIIIYKHASFEWIIEYFTMTWFYSLILCIYSFVHSLLNLTGKQQKKKRKEKE